MFTFYRFISSSPYASCEAIVAFHRGIAVGIAVVDDNNSNTAGNMLYALRIGMRLSSFLSWKREEFRCWNNCGCCGTCNTSVLISEATKEDFAKYETSCQWWRLE